MPLNKEGIETLKRDLRAEAARYDQSTFGSDRAPKVTGESLCGTVCCMAGFCLQRRLGRAEFDRRVTSSITAMERAWRLEEACQERSDFVDACLTAAVEQLGLEYAGFSFGGLPPVLAGMGGWPADLHKRYHDAWLAGDHAAKAEAACDALDRMDDRGTFPAELQLDNLHEEE